MVDSLYQAGGGAGGTHNAVLSSEEYMSTAARSLNNIEDGFYMYVQPCPNITTCRKHARCVESCNLSDLFAAPLAPLVLTL